jgi:hypothetical protein
MGLDALRAGADAPTPPAFVQLPRERVLADVQLQGAISDFHVIRDAVKDADCDPLLVRTNESDTYGDGGNYEVRWTHRTVQGVGASCGPMRRSRVRAACRTRPATLRHVTTPFLTALAWGAPAGGVHPCGRRRVACSRGVEARGC